MIEREVTSKLEGVLATLQGVESIYSESSTHSGFIRLEFTKIEDSQKLLYEVSTLIRRVSDELPEGVTYPRIYRGSQGRGTKTLLGYTLNGTSSLTELQKYAEENIVRALTDVEGTEDVSVYGAKDKEWVITYDADQLKVLGLVPADIISAIRNFLNESSLGLADYAIESSIPKKISVFLKPRIEQPISLDDIPLTRIEGRIVYLNSVCTIQQTVQKSQYYYRINGLNSVNIVVNSGPDTNELVVGKQVKKAADQLTATLPDNMSLLVNYDATEFLEQEIFDILWRMGLSVLILLLFVWATSKSLSYLLIVVASIACNIVIPFTLYYLLNIEIQLYSLADLTISLGVIIDNTIVMIDHLRFRGNRRIFLALLAATLTTIGALTIVFFLDTSQVLKLIDFASVLAINLTISLFISIYLIPSLVEKIPIRQRDGNTSMRRKRRTVLFAQKYLMLLGFISRFRRLLLVICLLVFGLPVYLLPKKINTGKTLDEKDIPWYINAYNETIGSIDYQENIGPNVEKWLGGLLYSFRENVLRSSHSANAERTKLYVRGSMQPGASLQQINDVFIEWENFISQFEEVAFFETRINSIHNAAISIEFKPEYELTAFPYYLKERLKEKANKLGGIDTEISGIGKGYNNAVTTGYKNTNLLLTGYSYKELLAHAERIQKRLVRNYNRISEVRILSKQEFRGLTEYEYYLAVDEQDMVKHGLDLQKLDHYLSNANLSDNAISRVNWNGEISRLRMEPQDLNTRDIWNVYNSPIATNGGSVTKLAYISEMKQRKTVNEIVRQDQQYRLILSFEFIGSRRLIEKEMEAFVEKTNELLPIGYAINPEGGGWGTGGSKYWVIWYVIALIFIIGATLLESVKQPLFIVLLIPFSFHRRIPDFHYFPIQL